MPAGFANDNPEIAAFLSRHHIGVLATADKTSSTPHAATVFYTNDSNLNIYFLTKSKTLKSKNLESNPQASMAIYEADNLQTIQAGGSVTQVKDEDMMRRALELMSRFSKRVSGSEQTPISKLDAGDYILYKLEPQFIRLGKYQYGTPTGLFEIATPAEESLEN